MGSVIEPKATVMAEWYEIVRQAESNAGLVVSEELECYLVNLLLRFMDKPEMAGVVLSLDYLLAEQSSSSGRASSLREVGDQCLLYSGLFPERAVRRRVAVSHFVELGQRSYASAALQAGRQQELAVLFAHLGQGFVRLMDILQTLRAIPGPDRQVPLMMAVKLWQDTGSEVARRIIAQHTQGFVVRGR